jgi:hypothetical protein
MSALLKSARVPGRKRQSLLPPYGPKLAAGRRMPVELLRRHFQTAVELEHSTLPPYLCALYSMDEQRNRFAYAAVQGVAMEEMLHMVQAANILVAIGGTPALNTPHFIPEYPTYLPHSDKAFLVPLQKFSPETLEIFLKIEKPAADCAPPEPNHYHTIGQFYAALRDNIVAWGDEIFTGDPRWQIGPDHYYGGGGQIIPVYNASDAVEAINQIVGQGEGIDGTIEDSDHVLFGEEIEYAHYFRFNEIVEARRYRPGDSAHLPPTGAPVEVDWQSALNFRPNPKLADYPVGSPLWQATLDFNKIYMKLLNAIQVACTGRPNYVLDAVPLMYELKYKAIALMNMPLGNAEQQTAGPSFEYVPI